MANEFISGDKMKKFKANLNFPNVQEERFDSCLQENRAAFAELAKRRHIGKVFGINLDSEVDEIVNRVLKESADYAIRGFNRPPPLPDNF